MADRKDKLVYFLYSEEQIKEKNNILSKVGKKFVPGSVYIGMSRKLFTQISDKDSMEQYIDTKVVAKGYKNQMKFDLPRNEKKEI
jgi:hypothetical protein